MPFGSCESAEIGVIQPEKVEQEWTEDYLANTCHILEQPKGTSTAMTRYPALCGRFPSHPPHQPVDLLGFECSTCGRPRCPECATRYQRGMR